MKIRQASHNDLITLLDLGEKLYLMEKSFEPLLCFTATETETRYTKQLKNEDALFLIAEIEGTIVGYLYAHADKVEYFDTDKLECEIEVIYIEPKYRGKGLAQELLQVCIDWAHNKNVFCLKTGIYAQNNDSIRAFTKLGFSPYHLTLTRNN